MSNHTVPADAGGMPSLFSPAINHSALMAMSLPQLRNLADGLAPVSEIVTAMTCQPRYSSRRHVLDAAGEQLARLSELLDDCQNAIVAEAARRECRSADEAADRARIIVQHSAASCGPLDDLADIAVAQADIVRQFGKRGA